VEPKFRLISLLFYRWNARKHAKARGDEYDQNGLHRHRSNSIRLIDAIMLDLGLQVDLESAALLRMTASALPKIKYLIR
jgi:hypothetical protein